MSKKRFARLIVGDIPSKTLAERSTIANWLRQQADAIEEDDPLSFDNYFIADLEKKPR